MSKKAFAWGRSSDEDYGSLRVGSKEYGAAVNGRREMINTLADRETRVRRKIKPTRAEIRARKGGGKNARA